MNYQSKPVFVRIKQKGNTTKNLKNCRKIFDELSVNYRQTSGDSYLVVYPTVLIPHFSQVYLLKHAKV